jgi:hypothetical protein
MQVYLRHLESLQRNTIMIHDYDLEYVETQFFLYL